MCTLWQYHCRSKWYRCTNIVCMVAMSTLPIFWPLSRRYPIAIWLEIELVKVLVSWPLPYLPVAVFPVLWFCISGAVHSLMPCCMIIVPKNYSTALSQPCQPNSFLYFFFVCVRLQGKTRRFSAWKIEIVHDKVVKRHRYQELYRVTKRI